MSSKSRKSTKEESSNLCYKVEIKKPFVIDIRELQKFILERIDYYRTHPHLLEIEDVELTFKNIKREIENPSFASLTEDIIIKYTQLKETEERRPKKIIEMARTHIRNSAQKEIDVLIEEYINIARDYIKIDVFPETIKRKAFCPECNFCLENIDIDINSGIIECECGFEMQNFLYTPAIKDNGFSNTISATGYEDRDNFIKKISKKQGRIHSNFPPKLFEELDQAMVKRGYPTGEEIRKMTQNHLGEKPGTSLEILITILSDIKYPKYYNEVDYLTHIYWGWELLNFSHLENDLIEMYNKTQRVYNEIEGKERIAALNTEVRLYLQLKSLGYEVSRTRFRFQDSQESLEFHQSMWRKMCEATGYRYYSIL